ncbi:hypothetical protein CCACVL1_13424 [Corchorus capsularis]|uniref:F-box domain-containing protein n=1 Tax=Corchorus capsularis TaxID=210143 RepID=A0A1R3IB31_COCAP|nr:hypothetical protein CCACVL1_13424 [Corchorus capsularis]
MEIAYSLSIALQSHQPLIIATIVTLLSLIFAVRSFFKRPHKSNALGPATSTGDKEAREATSSSHRNCFCSCNGTSDSPAVLNGGSTVPEEKDMVTADVSTVVAERQSGASMMEQLVPEITTHALSYLDYPSLCRLSMTNSLMRKAANDDNAWKALYHKDFTLEQDSVTPVNGWKAYYAATRAIMNVNTEFFNIIRDGSLSAMGRFWLNADYVKCIHASGELFSGYNAVMQSWHLAFNWEQGVDFQVRDVRARVLTDMAWVTMKTYFDMDNGAFNMTNVFEFHNGRCENSNSTPEGMAMALLSAPPPSSPQTSFFQRPYSATFGSLTFIKYPSKPSIVPLSTASPSSSTSTAEDEPPALVDEPPFRGCKACGREELERGCNGEGRIQGGIATVPGFGWWPIKAYRPCPGFVASGGRYRRRGQSMDEVAGFGRVGSSSPVTPVVTGDDEAESRVIHGPF